jgi:hypothetical protein
MHSTGLKRSPDEPCTEKSYDTDTSETASLDDFVSAEEVLYEIAQIIAASLAVAVLAQLLVMAI